jgi:hypothetical protein
MGLHLMQPHLGMRRKSDSRCIMCVWVGKRFKKISGIRNTDPLAYAYLIKSFQMLNEKGLFTESVV